MTKIRCDALLVKKGMTRSREQAKRLILSGKVIIGEKRIDKCGTLIEEDSPVRLKEKERYVSRGGIKLEAALQSFFVSLEGKIALDSGSSTGGFTDCLLQHGIERVYAVDVGYGQLAWKIRNDPRVIVRERTNIRTLPTEAVKEPVNLITLDLSFISLRLVLLSVYGLLMPGGEVIALIKPQFEVGKGEVEKGGIIKSPEKQKKAVDTISLFAKKLGFKNAEIIDSPLLGAKGNKEFFIYLRKPEQ